MDEQRQQVYLDLIDKLWMCSSGEESNILDAHQDLIDDGLVETMKLVAASWTEEGDEDAADWLQNLAAQIAAVIDNNLSNGYNDEESVDFLIEVLEAVEESDADPKVMYPLLEANLEKLDENLAQVLRNLVTATLQDMEAEEAYDMAITVGNFCFLIQQFTLGNQANNIEIAIAGHEVIGIVLTREAFPYDWAMRQINLGFAYYKRRKGDSPLKGNSYRAYSENLERAIHCNQLALEVFTREDFKEEWALIQNNLGLAYIDRIEGDRAQNSAAAIAAFQAALEVRNRQLFPLEWSQSQNNLGLAYHNRIDGDRSDWIEKAIEYYQAALQVYPREANPPEWASLQNNLGIAYLDRIEGDRAQNSAAAIAAFQAALEVRNRQLFPLEWSQSQNNLGLAYHKRIDGDRSDWLEKAIEYYQAALQVYPREANPPEWASLQNNLGIAYLERIAGDKAQNCEVAIAAFQAALQVYTREDFPEKWAETQKELSDAYADRIRGDLAENLETAIAIYQDILQIYTREAFPYNWAETQNALGLTYSDRIRGDRAENLELAIAHCENALLVYTREAFPEDWAMVKTSLGMAYRIRLRGDEAENIDRSINLYKESLEVYSREAFPEDWAMIQNNLGNSYCNQVRGDKRENIELAIECLQAALEIYTREAFPEDWARAHNNLGNAYSTKIRDRIVNIDAAIGCYKTALEVYTREDFPQDWAMVQDNLGAVYSDQGQVAEAIIYFRKALEIRTPTALPKDCLDSGSSLGDTAFTAGLWAEAMEGYRVAIEALEQLRAWASSEARRQEILQKDINIYENMIQACVNNRQLDKAIEYVERSRSRRLVDLMASNDLYANGEIPPKVQEYLQQFETLQQRMDRERLGKKGSGKKPQLMPVGVRSRSSAEFYTTNRAALEAFNETIAVLEAEKQQIWEQLRRLDPVLSGEIKIDAPDFAAMQQLIDHSTTAILSFYSIGNDTYIFVLRQKQITCHICAGEGQKTLQDWINNNWLQPYIANKDLWKSQMSSVLTELASRLRLDDLIAQHLAGIEELILVPHLYLHQIPLAALPIADNRYLADRFLIRYAPSCQVLEFCQKRPPVEMHATSLQYGIVEDATEDLPFTNFESERIANLYHIPDNLRLKGRSQATVSNYRKLVKQVQGLHSSHHAGTRIDNPLESKLDLADGYITLGELMTPGWRSPNLSDVFLSCCETGLGLSPITDDILTIATGFLCAGARSVINTLWAVEDLATSLFSIFYYQYRQQGSCRAAALQQAQEELRNLSGQTLATVYQPQIIELLDAKFKQFNKARKEAKNNRDREAKDTPAYVKWHEEYKRYFTDAERILNAKKRLGNLCQDDFPFAHPYYWAAFTCSGLR